MMLERKKLPFPSSHYTINAIRAKNACFLNSNSSLFSYLYFCFPENNLRLSITKDIGNKINKIEWQRGNKQFKKGRKPEQVNRKIHLDTMTPSVWVPELRRKEGRRYCSALTFVGDKVQLFLRGNFSLTLFWNTFLMCTFKHYVP